MNAHSLLSEETIAWLLEAESPGARYLGMRDLLRLPADDPEMAAAREAAHVQGPIAAFLDHMEEDGYWSAPGPGYMPKYFSAVWSIIALAQLGASVKVDARVAKACAYVLDQALAPQGQFSASGAPNGTADCLQGNLCWALTTLGCEDPRLETAFAWMARSVTGEGLAPVSDRRAELRFFAGKCGPLFACGSNNKLPCAWGGVKVMLAFSRWPKHRWTPLITQAVEQGAEFLLHGDPARAAYPNGWTEKPSSNWWKFGFPVFYVTDMLQNVEALVGLGYGKDPRLEEALSMILQKRDAQGRWMLEYDYEGKTWASFGAKKQPNKWVTLRAVKVLLDPDLV
jgi:hypothetical protein